jgi:hypothetical protein
MKLKFLPVFLVLLAVGLALSAGSAAVEAQVAPSAFRPPLTLTVGGMVSGFNPEYGPNKLLGAGAYADVNVFRGFGVEAEGRWLRFHSYEHITQDNYLIGVRYQFLHLLKAQPYVKVLGGYSNMNFEQNIATGRFTDITAGGGLDWKLTRRIRLRGDYEYHYWPTFLNSNLTPYGVSLGVGYRIF